MRYNICVMPGDGIGPEIVAEARKVMEAAGRKFGLEFAFTEALIGGAAIDATGSPLPEATIAACKAADAVLLGAVGGPQWDTLDPAIRPEKGLLGIRKALGLFANLRPAKLFPELAAACCLRPDIVGQGLDVMVVRELTGGAYFGEPRGIEERGGEKVGFNTMVYAEHEVRRIAKVGFETARKRGRKLCSVDKANVLDVSRLWRAVVMEVAKDYPDVELSHMYVDNAAMQLVRAPSQFDVIVTENLFGDILSDEAAVITGSIGMLPSASLGDGIRACTSPSTARPRTSPERTWPIPWPPSCPWPCCSSIRSRKPGRPRPPLPSKRPAPGCWPKATAPATSWSRARSRSGARKWATWSWPASASEDTRSFPRPFRGGIGTILR